MAYPASFCLCNTSAYFSHCHYYRRIIYYSQKYSRTATVGIPGARPRRQTSCPHNLPNRGIYHLHHPKTRCGLAHLLDNYSKKHRRCKRSTANLSHSSSLCALSKNDLLIPNHAGFCPNRNIYLHDKIELNEVRTFENFGLEPISRCLP